MRGRGVLGDGAVAQPKIDAVQRPAATSLALHGPPTATIGGNAAPVLGGEVAQRLRQQPHAPLGVRREALARQQHGARAGEAGGERPASHLDDADRRRPRRPRGRRRRAPSREVVAVEQRGPVGERHAGAGVRLPGAARREQVVVEPGAPAARPRSPPPRSGVASAEPIAPAPRTATRPPRSPGHRGRAVAVAADLGEPVERPAAPPGTAACRPP